MAEKKAPKKAPKTEKNVVIKVAEKIKKDQLKPKPRWEILLKNYIFWAAFAVSVLVGAVASSVVIFRLSVSDWDVFHRLGDNAFSFTIKTLPYFWLIILAAFIFVAYYNFHHTKKGYKYGLVAVVGGSVTLSVVLGFAMFGAKVAQRIDARAMEHLPFYRDAYLEPRIDRWSQVDKGLIAGEVLKIEADFIEIESLRGGMWVVNIEKVPAEMVEPLKNGMIMEAVGQKVQERTFEAEIVRPWRDNFHMGHRQPKRF